MSDAVRAEGLVKRYGAFTAVDGIDFAIQRGECFGFLGPNGAGKTTTMQMIQAVSQPSAGSLRVLGLDPSREGKRVRQRIGVCPQEDNLDPDLRVRDNLRVYARYFQIPKKEAAARADELLAFVALEEKAKSKVTTLSGGMKRRLIIGRSLINDPELILLDEPTTGLDPQARHLIWRKLRELRDRGVTMVLTTHYMEEAERLCDRLVIMDRGRILAEGSPQALVSEHVGDEAVELSLPLEREAEILAGLDLEKARTERAGDLFLAFFDRGDGRAAELSDRAHGAGLRFLLRPTGLEDVFLTLTGRELDE